jgi:putrescine aminotransferase
VISDNDVDFLLSVFDHACAEVAARYPTANSVGAN